MAIPTEFQLGGATWKVILRKRLKGRFGDCDMKRQQIQILDTLQEDVKEQTFYHELTHAIQIAMGYITQMTTMKYSQTILPCSFINL